MELACEAARAFVAVPVEGLHQERPLHLLQAQGVDVVDEEQQRHDDLLAADAELGGLVDGIDCVLSGAGERNDVSLGGLGAQQERGHVGRAERVANRANDLASCGGNRFARALLGVVPRSVVRGDEEPALLPLLDQFRRQRVG